MVSNSPLTLMDLSHRAKDSLSSQKRYPNPAWVSSRIPPFQPLILCQEQTITGNLFHAPSFFMIELPMGTRFSGFQQAASCRLCNCCPRATDQIPLSPVLANKAVKAPPAEETNKLTEQACRMYHFLRPARLGFPSLFAQLRCPIRRTFSTPQLKTDFGQECQSILFQLNFKTAPAASLDYPANRPAPSKVKHHSRLFNHGRAASAATCPANSVTNVRRPVILLSSEYSPVSAADRGETMIDAAV